MLEHKLTTCLSAQGARVLSACVLPLTPIPVTALFLVTLTVLQLRMVLIPTSPPDIHNLLTRPLDPTKIFLKELEKHIDFWLDFCNNKFVYGRPLNLLERKPSC